MKYEILREVLRLFHLYFIQKIMYESVLLRPPIYHKPVLKKVYSYRVRDQKSRHIEVEALHVRE